MLSRLTFHFLLFNPLIPHYEYVDHDKVGHDPLNTFCNTSFKRDIWESKLWLLQWWENRSLEKPSFQHDRNVQLVLALFLWKGTVVCVCAGGGVQLGKPKPTGSPFKDGKRCTAQSQFSKGRKATPSYTLSPVLHKHEAASLCGDARKIITSSCPGGHPTICFYFWPLYTTVESAHVLFLSQATLTLFLYSFSSSITFAGIKCLVMHSTLMTHLFSGKWGDEKAFLLYSLYFILKLILLQHSHSEG